MIGSIDSSASLLAIEMVNTTSSESTQSTDENIIVAILAEYDSVNLSQILGDSSNYNRSSFLA